LLPALLRVQQDAPTLPRDATNPHYRSRYTSLDAIVEHIAPVLARHGLVWMTLPCRDSDGSPALRYRLAHAESGEAIEGVMPLLLTKSDPQGMGSAITYARRYSLCAVLNLVADEDDDGNTAAKPPARRAPGITGDYAAELTGLAKQLTDRKVWTGHDLTAALRAAGATDTASVTAAFGSLTKPQADKVGASMARLVNDDIERGAHDARGETETDAAVTDALQHAEAGL
jgi:hypothetical protein